MAETLTVPVSVAQAASDSALATHEVLDEAAHQQIAQTEDEDYKWLTDRLDALSSEVSSLRLAAAEQYQQMTQLLSTNQEQSRLLIEAQSQMITNLLSSVTSLSESALLRLIPPNLESSSQAAPEAEMEVVAEVVAEDVPMPDRNAAPASGKKRLRI